MNHMYNFNKIQINKKLPINSKRGDNKFLKLFNDWGAKNYKEVIIENEGEQTDDNQLNQKSESLQERYSSYSRI